MKSFSDLTFQLDETMLGQAVIARKPRRAQLLKTIATTVKDRLMGGQKKRVSRIEIGRARREKSQRKQRLDRATKTLKGLRDSGKFGNPGLEGKPQRKIADARMRAIASGLGKRKNEINKAAEAIAAKRGISVRDARKRVVRQAVSRAVNRMETKAARKRLNENLQQLDEIIDFTGGLGPIIGSAIQTLGQVGMDALGQRLAQRRKDKQLRRQKRQDLLSRQKSADMAMGVSPTTGVSGKIKINTNPRASVSQLRSTGGTQLGGSSVGKQFAAKY